MEIEYQNDQDELDPSLRNSQQILSMDQTATAQQLN
jgi:hypothetical protein